LCHLVSRLCAVQMRRNLAIAALKASPLPSSTAARASSLA
jgi:hypothetical protein